jgi:7,8-dihydropterin-6-yl-methyl-4-(beta-D-ribofuranosyl)aminobenzene 5'-phosphate synthase
MVKGLKLTVLVDDSAGLRRGKRIPPLRAEHGLSISIDVETRAKDRRLSLLMDVGPSSEVVIRNAEALKVDLRKTRLIFLTHGHYDHTGGLIGVLKHIGRRVPIVAHPRIFEPKLKHKPFLTDIGTPFTSRDVEAYGGLLLLSRSPVLIMEDALSTGEIERVIQYETVNGFWTISRERFVEDYLIDEQALVFKVDGKGLVILSGCSHPGIMNTVQYAKKITNVEKVYAVVGGFHLYEASDERIQRTIDGLRDLNPELVCPCHCTGKKTFEALEKVFGDNCKVLFTGCSLIL